MSTAVLPDQAHEMVHQYVHAKAETAWDIHMQVYDIKKLGLPHKCTNS